ncbi:hypothetical protein ACTXT7_010867 [Hymenolepis weldensis]
MVIDFLESLEDAINTLWVYKRFAQHHFINTLAHIVSGTLAAFWDKNCYQSGDVLISKHQQHEDNLRSYIRPMFS